MEIGELGKGGKDLKGGELDGPISTSVEVQCPVEINKASVSTIEPIGQQLHPLGETICMDLSSPQKIRARRGWKKLARAGNKKTEESQFLTGQK